MREGRAAIRSLWRDRWFSACALAVISLAIAFNLTVFAVVDGVLFKPLPFQEPDDLFVITRGPAMSVESSSGLLSQRDLVTLRQVLPHAGIAYVNGGPGSIGLLEGRAALKWAVSPDLLDLLGVQLVIGGFTPSDLEWYAQFDATDHDRRPPVLISHSLWQRMFAGDSEVVGRAVTLNQVDERVFGFRVAGVLPDEFVFPFPDGEFVPDLLAPWVLDPSSPGPDENCSLIAIARVPGDGNPHEAGNRLTALANRIGLVDGVLVRPLNEVLGRAERAELVPVFLAAAALLTLSLINVVGVVAARATIRQREYAIRRALGASRSALVRQVLLEVAPLTVIGAGIALVATPYVLTATRQLLPDTMMLLKQPTPDARVFVAAALMCAAGTAVVTVLVALAVDRRSAQLGVLTSRAGRSGRAFGRGGRLLIGLQASVATVLVVLASTFGLGFASAWGTDPGYAADRLAVVDAGAVSAPDVAGFTTQAEDLVTLLRSVPGVESVAGSEVDFVSGFGMSMGTEYAPATWNGPRDDVRSFQVAGNFFEVLGLELRAGRWPEPEEWQGRAPVALVSEAAARRFWPNSDAVGRVLHSSRRRTADPPTPVTVIGIVSDAQYRALDLETTGAVYVPQGLLDPNPPVAFFVRTSDRADRVLPRLVEAVRADSRFRLERARTAGDALFASVRPRALRAWLFGWFGLVSLVVVAVGIVSLVVASTARRRREIAIRVAVGARPSRIIRMFVAEQGTPIVAGLAVGAVAGFFIVPSVATVVVPQADTAFGWTIAGLLLVGTALVSALAPAAWTSRVDPMQTLRAE